ncbi:hypothetical protein [Streptomyces naphthomycinicus]|uniref:hypothetical protein n=1 Tax=Streptomyces naphthomycinicus TaxID=2872625 RepID=UPI001CEDD78B|nr:hypothetical protein [Streptomyces sp. TML10]
MLKKFEDGDARCVACPAGAAGAWMPVPAALVVVVVLVLTVIPVAAGVAREQVIAAVVAGGLMGTEVVRRLVTVSSRRAR